MLTREQVAEVVTKGIADIFMMDASHVAGHPELNFRTDLNATSLQYFPLIADMEEKLDIELDSHDFQWIAKTVGDAVEFVYKAYTAQKAQA